MNILIALDPNERAKRKLNPLINVLKSQHRIGIVVMPTGASNLEGNRLKYFTDISAVDEKDWDLVLIQNIQMALIIAKRIKKKPMVFISTSEKKEDQCINLPNIYHIINAYSGANTAVGSIPLEFISPLNIPVSAPYNKGLLTNTDVKNRSIVYFVSDEDEDLKISRSIIKTINFIPSVQLTIISSVIISRLLQDSANSNISFLSRIDFKNIAENHRLAIGSGSLAIMAALSGMPVLVAGIKGLGGMLTSENLPDFVRTGFKGRIGGVPKEEIPLALLSYEIRCTLGIEKDNAFSGFDLQEEDYNKLHNYFKTDWKNKFRTILKETFTLYQYITEKKNLQNLVPHLVSVMELKDIDQSDEVLIINTGTGKLLGCIGKNEAAIIRSCQGGSTIDMIAQANSAFSQRDVIDFILDLWRNKVLKLELPK